MACSDLEVVQYTGIECRHDKGDRSMWADEDIRRVLGTTLPRSVLGWPTLMVPTYVPQRILEVQ